MIWRLALLAFLAAVGINAQDSGKISGTVRDDMRAAVMGARLTCINQATHAETIVYTVNDGSYRVINLDAPQSYTVEAFRSGFQTFTRRDLHLGAAGDLRLDIELVAA